MSSSIVRFSTKVCTALHTCPTVTSMKMCTAHTSTMNSLHSSGQLTPAFLISCRYSKLPWKYFWSVSTLRHAAPPSSYALAICYMQQDILMSARLKLITMLLSVDAWCDDVLCPTCGASDGVTALIGGNLHWQKQIIPLCACSVNRLAVMQMLPTRLGTQNKVKM